jgi:hypothetical protein
MFPLWSKQFPGYKKPLGYLRLMMAQYRYFPHYVRTGRKPFHFVLDGDYVRLAALRNKHAGKRCFVIANGPSLNDMDLTPLKNEITMGCNAIYKKFGAWGFKTNYLVMEDMEQTELRAREYEKIDGVCKLAAIHNAYAFKMSSDIRYFNAGARSAAYYWTDLYPRFSDDFASVVYMGGTVTYIMLQLAYFMGCDPVYIIGLDFDYGQLPDLFPPGKIAITEDNIHLVRGLHADADYYKVGDVIGVPFVKKQKESFECAAKYYQSNNRRLYNASARTKLDCIERCDYDQAISD